MLAEKRCFRHQELQTYLETAEKSFRGENYMAADTGH
jgi:hypothetical protein